LSLFNPNLDLLEAVKARKSRHHLSHDQASKEHGSILDLMAQTDLHAYLQITVLVQEKASIYFTVELSLREIS